MGEESHLPWRKSVWQTSSVSMEEQLGGTPDVIVSPSSRVDWFKSTLIHLRFESVFFFPDLSGVKIPKHLVIYFLPLFSLALGVFFLVGRNSSSEASLSPPKNLYIVWGPIPNPLMRRA